MSGYVLMQISKPLAEALRNEKKRLQIKERLAKKSRKKRITFIDASNSLLRRIYN